MFLNNPHYMKVDIVKNIYFMQLRGHCLRQLVKFHIGTELGGAKDGCFNYFLFLSYFLRKLF